MFSNVSSEHFYLCQYLNSILIWKVCYLISVQFYKLVCMAFYFSYYIFAMMLSVTNAPYHFQFLLHMDDRCHRVSHNKVYGRTICFPLHPYTPPQVSMFLFISNSILSIIGYLKFPNTSMPSLVLEVGSKI